jgi:CheY-like chemotaxis protein
MRNLLVVDDDPGVRYLVVRAMTQHGWRVWEADSVPAALNVASEVHLDLVLCDVVMPNKSGYDLLSAFRSAPREIPVILMSGHPFAHSDKGSAPSWGAPATVLEKPFRLRDFIGAAERLMADGARPRTRQANR